MSRISRLEHSQVTPDIAELYDKVYAQRATFPTCFA